MLKATTALAVSVVLLGVTGCAEPMLTRRYNILNPPGVALGDGSVDLTASTFAVDPPTQKTLFDLSSEGQASFIEAVSRRTAANSPLQNALAAPIVKPSTTGIVDRTSVSRRVVLSVSAKHQGSADRLDESRIILTLAQPSQAKFTTWNQLVTKFEVVDLGKLTFSQKNAASLALEGVIPGIKEITGATAELSRERSMGEEVQLRQRYVATTGELTPTRGAIIQQGAVGIDLVGNAVFDITVVAADVRHDRLYATDGFFASGKALDPKSVVLQRRVVRFANQARDWTVDVVGTFRRRVVVEGAATVTESDDTVSYETRQAESHPILVAEEDLRVSKWVLLAPGCNVVHIADDIGTLPLQFDTFAGAEDALAWLRATDADNVAGRRIGFFNGTTVNAPAGPSRWAGLTTEIVGVNWIVPRSCLQK